MLKLQVEFRTGRLTAEWILASDLYAEPMNETAMKLRSALCASNLVPKTLSRNQTESAYKYSSGSIYLMGSPRDYAGHSPR
jgi:hypothetical protein